MLLLVGLSVLGFGLLSKRAERTVLTAPMAFVLIGIVVGPVLGLVELGVGLEAVHVLAEVTLALILFTDASRIDVRSLKREHDLPVRLLTIALPLTIVAGTLIGLALFPSLGLWGAATLAVILAPTDAALGMAVVSNERVPARIRQTLNVESGLNDGIAFPIFLIFLSLAGGSSEGEGVGFWTRFVALQLLLGPLVGVAVGYLGGRVVDKSSRSGWMSHAFQELSVLGLALLAFAGAELVGGNGFIAAFAAGLTIGNTSRSLCSCLWDFGEAEGQLLTLLVFLALGAVLIPEVMPVFGWTAVIYAVLSLTLIRIVPTALSLLGTGVRPLTTLFLGWFGPRGIASVVFVLLLLEGHGLPEGDLIAALAILTVLLSVFAHGITAYPGAELYARRAVTMNAEGDSAEHRAVSPLPMRTRRDAHAESPPPGSA